MKRILPAALLALVGTAALVSSRPGHPRRGPGPRPNSAVPQSPSPDSVVAPEPANDPDPHPVAFRIDRVGEFAGIWLSGPPRAGEPALIAGNLGTFQAILLPSGELEILEVLDGELPVGRHRILY